MDAVKKTYNLLYTTATLNQTPYGYGRNRESSFIRYIREYVPVGASVFDAGCGRGQIIKWLNMAGYKAFGCEIADELFKEGRDLHKQPVTYATYDDLASWDKDQFDVVISNDVLEHLLDEDEARRGYGNLVGISKQFVLVSVGLRNCHNPFHKETGLKELHSIVMPKKWWRELFSELCELDEVFEAAASFFMFGKKK